jgi:hypothetical protein
MSLHIWKGTSMNLKRTPFWALSLGCALVMAGSPLACGGNKDPGPDGGGDAGAPGDDDEEGSGGKSSSSSGGKSSSSSGGRTSGSSGGRGSMAGDTGSGGDVTNPGTGGGGSTEDATIVDLITTLCNHEFDCCTEGEITYRFGSTADTAAECIEDFTYLYQESNTASVPFPTLSGLLITLGYSVDPERVTENPAGIAECIAAQEAMDCPTLIEADPGRVYCTPGAAAKDPCALNNLFKPKLKAGDECTLSLAEGAQNDVECAVGTTCVSADDPDNAKDVDACVTRGLAGAGCTTDSDCDYNFYCESGDCTAKGDEGDDCSFNDPDAPAPGDENAGCKGGLACSPDTLKCVAACKADFPCEANVQCPEGSSCRPITVGDDSSTWKACQEIGNSAAARCNDDEDCVAGRYCDGSVCQQDLGNGEYCTRDQICETGLYCAGYLCAALIQAGETCTPTTPPTNNGCVATAKYCLSDPDSDPLYPTYSCVKSLRKASETCTVDAECLAGLKCEVTTDDPEVAWPRTCTAGAGAGDDCDADVADPEMLQCGAGLVCLEGACEPQLEPGEDCEDPDAPGYPRSDFCKNSACVENWDEDGVDFICSDTGVPKTNGGDGLTCGE